MQQRETQKTINTLRDSQEPIDEAELVHLSNLTREEQEWLDEAWTVIPLDKRRRLIGLLAQQAEEDIQLNFSAVFRRGLRDRDAQVRQASIDGLWEDESLTLLRPLLRLLHDEDEGVRASAATALGRFVLQGELGHLSSERYEELIETLVKLARNPLLSVAVRRRAVEAIAYSSDERVRDIIARAYEEEADEMRASALFAMGRSADEYWSGQVRGELSNENPALRYEAARAAGELGDRRAVLRLIPLAVQGDPVVRDVAIWALGQIGGPVAKEALKQIAQGEQGPSVRRAARDALAELALIDEGAIALFSDAEVGEAPLSLVDEEDEEREEL